jgi:hypothetical protein
MAREEIVRELLHLDPRDQLDERGVFPPPETADLATPPGTAPLGDETTLTAEWLGERDLEQLFSADSTIEAALPSGQVKRLDVDPRVLVFEGVPTDTTAVGAVVAAAENRLIMDARVGPALLAFSEADHEVIILGERGDLRLFVLRRAT